MIQPTINDGDKITALTSMYSHIVKELGKHSHLVPVFAQIHEYCWILFEVDLKRIKQAFDEMYQASVINPNHPRLAELVKSDPTVQDTVKSLNADLQHRFNTVRTWLARPTSVSPSASIELLVQAVLDEIRDRYPSLTHDPILEGDTKLDLLGHRFQFFYDALFVLIDNAAKYGNNDIPLKVESRTRMGVENNTDLSVSVTSGFKQSNSSECRANIEKAMHAEIGDALLYEKESGLRKVRCLVEDIQEIQGFEHLYDDDKVVFTIKLTYPNT